VEAILLFILRHGYAVLFGAVFAEQIGLPLPALPILLGIGSLSAQGRISYQKAMIIGTAASLLADLIWYTLGRLKGSTILRRLCRLSLEPDTCVRRTEQVFGRHGAWVLLYAKFVPGLNTVAPPLAGAIRLSIPLFLASDGLGAVLWIGVFSGLGYIFSSELDRAVWMADRLGIGALLSLAAILAVYIFWKAFQRRAALRKPQVVRITPDELKEKLDRGLPVTLVDLRHGIELETERVKIPGALHVPPEEIEARQAEIPRNGEVVLYCT
jgi:membrane protein DedA with SNARE-associated domain